MERSKGKGGYDKSISGPILLQAEGNVNNNRVLNGGITNANDNMSFSIPKQGSQPFQPLGPRRGKEAIPLLIFGLAPTTI